MGRSGKANTKTDGEPKSDPWWSNEKTHRIVNTLAMIVLAFAAVIGIPISISKLAEDGPQYNLPPEPQIQPESSPSPSGSSEAPQLPDDVRFLGPLIVYVDSTNNVNFTNTFRDPDGDVLTLTAKSEDTEIFEVSDVSGFFVTLSGKKEGSSFVTVTATDPTDKSVWISIRVNVLPQR